MQFNYAMIPPPAHWAEWFHTFYTLEIAVGRAEEFMPAYSAQIMIFLEGGVTIDFPGGRNDPAESLLVNAPQLAFAPCTIHGPVRLVGVSLTPTGWQRFAARPVDAVHDQVLAPDTVFAPEALAELRAHIAAAQAGEITSETLATALATAITAQPFPLPAGHGATLAAMTAWLASSLDPPLAALHAAVDLSPRQLQRFSRRYFGVAPWQVAKRFRAIRAAMLLANPLLPHALRDAALESYFDQAHLIRNIRRYTGRTPRQLRDHTIFRETLVPHAHGPAARLLDARPDAAGGDDSPLKSERIAPISNSERIRPN